jgi:DNA-binding transcriptional MocR family regulator
MVRAQLKIQSPESGLEIQDHLSFMLAALGAWSAGRGPLYRRLADALRSAVDRGDLPPGTRLPPERLLARTLSVSRSTVVAAYDLLEQVEVLDRRQGSGTRVAETNERHRPADPAPVSRALSRNTLFRRITDGPDGTIDFIGAYLLGGGGLLAAALEGLELELAALSLTSGYSPLGHPPLRQAVAAHLTRTGLPTVPEQVIITSGAQQAINLAAWQYLHDGDTVVVENPTYPGALDAFSAAGARLAWVPTGRHGADVDLLSEVVTRTTPRLVYLIPTFQNPVGGVMPEHRRRAVARLVEARGVALIEDNSLAALALDGDGAVPPPIAAFAPEAPILTVGSVSKLFWAGLRVGWIRAPESVVANLGRLKAVADLGGSLPGQAIATRLLGHFDAVRQERCAELARRFALMAQLLEQQLPSWSWERPRGGLCLWVRLPHGSASEFAQVALRHGVSLVAGPVASADHSFADYVRLPFGLEPPELEEGIHRLARAWAAYTPLVEPQHQAFTVIV